MTTLNLRFNFSQIPKSLRPSTHQSTSLNFKFNRHYGPGRFITIVMSPCFQHRQASREHPPLPTSPRPAFRKANLDLVPRRNYHLDHNSAGVILGPTPSDELASTHSPECTSIRPGRCQGRSHQSTLAFPTPNGSS